MFEKYASDAFVSGAADALNQMNIPGHIKEAAFSYVIKEAQLTPEQSDKMLKSIQEQRALAADVARSRTQMATAADIARMEQEAQAAASKATGGAGVGAAARGPVGGSVPSVGQIMSPADIRRAQVMAAEQAVAGQATGLVPASHFQPQGAAKEVIELKPHMDRAAKLEQEALKNMSKLDKLKRFAGSKAGIATGLGLLATGAGAGAYGMGMFDEEPEPLPQDFMSRLQRGGLGMSELSTEEKALLAAGGTAALGGIGYGASQLL